MKSKLYTFLKNFYKKLNKDISLNNVIVSFNNNNGIFELILENDVYVGKFIFSLINKKYTLNTYTEILNGNLQTYINTELQNNKTFKHINIKKLNLNYGENNTPTELNKNTSLEEAIKGYIFNKTKYNETFESENIKKYKNIHTDNNVLKSNSCAENEVATIDTFTNSNAAELDFSDNKSYGTLNNPIYKTTIKNTFDDAEDRLTYTISSDSVVVNYNDFFEITANGGFKAKINNPNSLEIQVNKNEENNGSYKITGNGINEGKIGALGFAVGGNYTTKYKEYRPTETKNGVFFELNEAQKIITINVPEIQEVANG